MAPQDAEIITIERISEKEVRVLCGGKWKTLRQYDKGFSQTRELFRIARIAHGICCSTKGD